MTKKGSLEALLERTRTLSQIAAQEEFETKPAKKSRIKKYKFLSCADCPAWTMIENEVNYGHCSLKANLPCLSHWKELPV